MAATLPAGAYVIRNRGTSTVIHNNDDVTTSERDEEHHRERQIWWVETSPSLGELGDKIATVYRIGNIGKGVSLDVHSCEDRSKVIAFPNHGSPWQLWRLEKQPECTDGQYNHILNANSGLALDARSNLFRSCRLDCTSPTQSWEFQKPVVSVPAGWLRIQNVVSRQVLSLTYSSLPPITVVAPISPSPIESWATQWSFTHASALGDGKAGNRSYLIKNRLTGTYLRCWPSKLVFRDAAGSVNAWETTCKYESFEFWRFELDEESNWRVVHSSGPLLEEVDVPLLGGNEVVCTNKTPHEKKTWDFVAVDTNLSTSNTAQ